MTVPGLKGVILIVVLVLSGRTSGRGSFFRWPSSSSTSSTGRTTQSGQSSSTRSSIETTAAAAEMVVAQW